jgi:MFS transporter, UMF1 family
VTEAADRQRRGWYLYGWASQTFPTVVTTVFMSRYLTSVAENAVGKHGRVHVLGIPIAPGSLFVYTVTAATILLVALMPLVGAIADRTGSKRDIMLGCGWFGAAACVAMVSVKGTNWQLGAVLYALAFLGYSCSIVVSYSLLVDLSGAEERDRVSSTGWAIAYVGGGSLLAMSFVLSLFIDKSTLARISLCAAGVWWIAWSIPVFRRLPRVIGKGAHSVGGNVLSAGFRQLRMTMRHIRGLPLTLGFLIAFLIYNDGIQTVTTVAAQYGDKQLDLSDTVLLTAILLVQFVAFAGALWLGRLAGTFGAKRVVLGSLLVWIGCVVAGYYLQPGVIWQFFALAIVIALVLGGSQALSRAMFSRMIPVGTEAEYFAFYEISDSGTSWLGPLVFGLTYQNTGSYRGALVSLVVFFVVGFVLLARVPVRRAVEAAGNEAPALL